MLTEKQFVELAKEEKIIIKIPMSRLHNFMGVISYKDSNSKKKKVECKIVPKDIFKDNYFKLYLVAKDKTYGKEEYYLQDLLSSIKQGYAQCIIKN